MSAARLAAVAVSAPLARPNLQTLASARLARAFDVVLAVGLLIVFAPLMLACAAVVRASSRGPIFYRQVRIGRAGEEFHCLKFRTMRTGSSRHLDAMLSDCRQTRDEWAKSHKLKVDPRITRAGHFLRRYSLDELPQLFNVITGEMSIVGPRPIVAAEIPRYGAKFRDYCRVKPGITGLWQVSGRHALSYNERVRLDAEYARSKSIAGDVGIILRTVPVVIFGQNE